MKMTPLLSQFLLESRDFLDEIGTKLIALESEPDSNDLMNELFRLVHTLKGNSGLFDVPAMTRVLHAGEDLMDAVRNARLSYSQELADQLLATIDFVAVLLSDIEQTGEISSERTEPAEVLVRNLRQLIPAPSPDELDADADEPSFDPTTIPLPELSTVPETARMEAFRRSVMGSELFLIAYRPEAECFFKGEDPFYQVRQLPGLVWGHTQAREPWPPLLELDCYRCNLDFHLLAASTRSEVDEHFRYTPEQAHIQALSAFALVIPQGQSNGGPVYADFVDEALKLLHAGDVQGLADASRVMLELSAPGLWLSSALRWLQLIIEVAPEERTLLERLITSLTSSSTAELTDWAAQTHVPTPTDTAVTESEPATRLSDIDQQRLTEILAVQSEILALSESTDGLPGRLQACAATIAACLANLGEPAAELDEALAAALELNSAQPLAEWLAALREGMAPVATTAPAPTSAAATPPATAPAPAFERRSSPAMEPEAKFGRRAEDNVSGKVLKVDQTKIDRLMNLIGEMIVAKNALPYLAKRAEDEFGTRELGREIKTQYAVINRIAEEMQDSIMQVRMMPVSFVFQRFPRLVRDISRKLGKQVELVLEGEDTEADKNVIEALADPLIHIVRNSLDHGLEVPEVRQASGKPPTGQLRIRASQESDRVMIEISDDGGGINPTIIKRKAYEKGVLDEAQLERITDQEAVQLVFAARFSTVDEITDLSGRGVGMDVVRTAIDKVGGSIDLHSQVGEGTTIRLSLPLSMAVTHVMVFTSDGQNFAVPMDRVVETIRMPVTDIRTIKRSKTLSRRGKIIPLMAINELLAIPAEPQLNSAGEFTALVVRIDHQPVALMVDEFRGVMDVILKPLPGELARLKCYAGAALLGDGSVLIVLNPKELIEWA